MISPFRCVNSHRPGTGVKVPASGQPLRVKRWRLWTCNVKKRASKVSFGCCHNLNAMASVPSPGPRWRGRWSKANSSSFIGKSKLVTSRSGFSFSSVRHQAILNGVPDEESATDSTSLAFKICWNGLAALTLTLSTVLVTQPEPAYAKFGSPLRSGVHQIVSSSESSVEAILAKQLARRFREMSDEELVETLQQLLKASRSSPSSRTAVDEGTVPENLTTTPKDSWKLDAKTKEKIGAEFRGPEKEPDAGSDKVKDGDQTFQRTPAKRPGDDKPSNGEFTPPVPTADANSQAKKGIREKIEEMEKVTEPQGQGFSKERPDLEQTNGDARLPGAQNGTGNGNAALTNFPTVEANRKTGDSSSGESLSDVPDTGDAAASATGALRGTPSDEAGGAAGQTENATELLWKEWSRRAAVQTAEETGGSASASNATEIWQNVQTSGVLIGSKLIVLITSIFDSYKKVIGILFGGSLSIVYVFYLGRSRAASMKKASSGEQTFFKEQQENRSSRIRSQDGFARGGLEPQSPTLSENAPGRNRRSTIANDGSTASTANWERPSEATREPANRSVRSTTTPELTTAMQRKSGLDGVSSGEGDQIAAEPPGGRGNSFIRSDASSPYQQMIPMNDKEKTDRISDTAGRQTQYRRFRDPGNYESLDTTTAGNKGLVNSTGKDWNGREPGAQDQANQEATTSDNSVLRTSGGGNYDRDRLTVFPTRVDQGVQETKSGINLGVPDKLRSSFADGYSQNSGDNQQEENASGAFDVNGPSFNRWGRPRKRNSARVRSKPNQGLGGRGQDSEGITPGRVKEMRDSFVHGSILWVRDNDGVFVPESDTQEGNAAKASNTPSPQETVLPTSSNANGSLQTRSPKGSRNGSQIGYDYRQLVIEPSSKTKPLEGEQQEPGVAFTNQSEPVAQGKQMWPLRYGHAERQPMYK